jgi:hypothetical protein
MRVGPNEVEQKLLHEVHVKEMHLNRIFFWGIRRDGQ